MGTTRTRHSVELSRNHWLQKHPLERATTSVAAISVSENSRLSAVQERERLQQLLFDPCVAHDFQITGVHNEEYDEWTPVS